MVSLTKADLFLVKDALESAQAEFEQLMLDKEWYVTDVVDLQESALELVNTSLGITKIEEDYDE